MRKEIIFVLLSFFLFGCSGYQAVGVQPMPGVEFSVPVDSKVRIEMQDKEIYLYKESDLIASVERVDVLDDRTAIESLREGIVEAQKGTNKPVVLELADGGFGFVVHAGEFSTIFIASESYTSQWAVISVKRKDFEHVISKLNVGS